MEDPSYYTLAERIIEAALESNQSLPEDFCGASLANQIAPSPN